MSQELPSRRFKRGDPSPNGDGKVFVGYSNKREWWATQEWLDAERARLKEKARAYRKTPKSVIYRSSYSRRTDVREKAKKYRTSEEGKKYFSAYKKTEKAKLASKEYSKRMRPKIRERYRGYEKRYHASNPMAKIAKLCRNRIRDGMRKSNVKKWAKSVILLGCSFDFFKKWIEAKWKAGMTWENWGIAWHVDHVLPVKSFDLSTLAGQLQCFRFSNTQPLWKEENFSKGSKLNFA